LHGLAGPITPQAKAANNAVSGTESGWRHPRCQVFLTVRFSLKSLARRLARRNEKLTAWCDKLPHMSSGAMASRIKKVG